MAKKELSAVLAKRLNAMGIKVKTDDEARKKLLKVLSDNGIDGMEDETIDVLIDMAESFVEDETSEEEEKSEEEEAEELAEETDDDEAEEEEVDDEVEDEEEEKPAPKKSTKKAAPVKKEVKKAVKKEAAEKKVSKRGTKLNPKGNEDDRQYFEPLKKLFPERDYLYAWVASSGVTIKNKGKNSNRSMVLIENCSLKDKGQITCNLYLLTFTKNTEILDEKGIEYETCWSGAPLIKNITFEEAIEIINAVFDEIVSSVSKIDKKLGENRKKMEDSLKKSDKKSTKKAAPVEETEDDEEPEEEEVDDEVEDEEEEEKPAPKKSTKTKKVAKSKK